MKTKPITISIRKLSPNNEYNNIQISSSSQQIPNYLNKNIIDEFAHLKIKSDDGQHYIQINHLLWTSWSIFPKELLKDMFNEGSPEDMIISTDFCIDSLKIFGNFIMYGQLPFSDVDILEDKLPKEIYSMFLTFGIDIKFIVSSFHIKIEEKEEDENIFFESQNFNEKKYNYSEKDSIIKREELANNDDNFDEILNKKTESEDESSIQYGDNYLEEIEQLVNIQTSLNIENNTTATNSCCCKKGFCVKLQNELKCDFCEQTFSWSCQMKAHRQKIHNNVGITQSAATLKNRKKKLDKTFKMVQCHLCCHTITKKRKNDLNRHIKWHSNIRSKDHQGRGTQDHFCDKTVQIHKCDFCDASSDVLYCIIGLKSHTKRIHERSENMDNAVGKIPCDICNNKSYETLTALKIHRKRTHNISCKKEHNCDQCTKVFKDSYALKKHTFSIHLKKNERKNNREICPKSKFVCESCGKGKLLYISISWQFILELVMLLEKF